MKDPITLNPWERAELERIALSDLPSIVILRAKAILLAAEGMPNVEIAQHTGYSQAAISRLRVKFGIVGINKLFYRKYERKSKPRTGPKPRYLNPAVLVDQSTRDGLRAMAKAHGTTIKDISNKMIKMGVKHYYETIQGT